ncbi:MAG: DUF2955 domain-containing protein [Gammaproteobacteria bacterium]
MSTSNLLSLTLRRITLFRNKPSILTAIRGNQQNIRIIRFAVGVTLAVALSSGIDWPLAFLVPILSSVFLAMPIPRPSLHVGLKNMLYTVSAFFIGVVFTLFLLPYPLAYVPMLALALFNLYYMLNRGGSLWFVLMALLGVLILPMLGNNSEGLAAGFAYGFVVSGWVTVLMLWLAFFLVPDPVDTPAMPKKPGLQTGFSLPAAQAALKSTVVVLPLVVLFITLNLLELIVVMVFTAIFTLAPDISKGKTAGINSMKSTLIGGFYAFMFYYLLVAVPQYYFFITLMFLTTLVFARNIFSNKPNGKYYASAFSTLFILVNSSLGEGADFTSAFIMRFTFILLATLYVVFSLMLFEHYWPQQQITK